MQTFFIPVSRGEASGIAAVVASSPAEAVIALIPSHQGCKVDTPIAMSEHPACSGCFVQEKCNASAWEGVPRSGAESSGCISSVHTCKSCLEKVVTFDYRTKSYPVPSACPRWTALFGSACDCATCIDAREAIEKAHPAHAPRMEAAQGALQAMFKGASIDDAVEAIVSATTSFNHVQPTDAEMTTALKLSHLFLVTAMREQAFIDEITQNKDWDIFTCQFEWAEAIILILRRHPSDVNAIVHEWTLVFDDRPPWCRAWVRVPVNRRRMIIRGWEVAVRETLGLPLIG